MSGPLDPVTEQPSYGLIFERHSPRPVAAVAQVLAAELGMHPTDASSQVRYGGGLLAKGLEPGAARAAARRLQAIGVDTRAIEDAAWLTTPRGRKVFAFEVAEECAFARLLTGEDLVVTRDDVMGLHLYGLLPASRESAAAGSVRTSSATRLQRLEHLDVAVTLSERTKLLLARLKEAALEEMEFHCTVYCSAPLGILRLRKNELDFSSLADDKLDHSLDNFLLLLEGLLDFAPHAWHRERLEGFLEDLDPRAIHYFKKEEAENFDRWTWQWMCLEAEGGSAPES